MNTFSFESLLTTVAMRILAVLACLVFGNCAQAAQYLDSCQARLPDGLAASVAMNFPGYRMPREADNLPEDVRYNKKHGGSGCLGVAIGDFDGDGKKDYLLGLAAANGPSGLAVIALMRKEGWEFRTIRSWAEDFRGSQYVAVVKPGKYYRTESLDGPLDPGERKSMQCRYRGALVGTIGSTGIVYCNQNEKWLHVWISD